MKAAALSLLALCLALTVGCANKKTEAAKADSSALDVSATPAYQPAPLPPAAPPMVTETPIMPAAPAPMPVMSGTHTVRKGDTLYSIAKARYGDGKQWTRIQQANPGVAPQSLKVGQTLVIP